MTNPEPDPMTPDEELAYASADADANVAYLTGWHKAREAAARAAYEAYEAADALAYESYCSLGQAAAVARRAREAWPLS
jgi:hypothetical protein